MSTLYYVLDQHRRHSNQLKDITDKGNRFCVKTRDQNNTKIFVNICTTDAIPPPKDITESELLSVIDAEDASDFRVPMSIGEIRTEDCKGQEAKACDVAIHPTFFKKVEQKQSFKNFFLAVVFQGLENKYGIVCEDDKRILVNKKCFGTLQMHRIQQREIAEKMGLAKPKSTMEQLTGDKGEPSKKVMIETISSEEYKTKEPEYRIYKKNQGPNCLIGEFKFPDILSGKELTLDVGEDRILLESKSKGYLLDVFVPYCIRNGKCTSSFNQMTKILTVNMPLIGG
ncbi:hypothetical protein GWI33_014526 [Rhynchophorus ferrugineus]|uniref:PIH1 domain-containing protein 1 n=1 Tax=Rhynchophorus ferrugineus TaxID=354439 RepID=A0A834MC97_RHYFE|nr:hypothetical protein GWI33_014526 [Rhynchophorus ferrugineus]